MLLSLPTASASNGAPARRHTSRSPVASITTRPSSARRPCLLSKMTPLTFGPSRTTSAAQLWKRNRTPAAASSSTEASFSHSGSIIGDHVTTPRNAPWRPPQWATSSSSCEPH